MLLSLQENTDQNNDETYIITPNGFFSWVCKFDSTTKSRAK